VTSLELHLRDGDAVVEAQRLEDVAAGVYPAFYRRCGSRLKVSTSVVALIRDAGDFIPDESFRPPDYLRGHFTEDWMYRVARKANRHFGWPALEPITPAWYASWNSIDVRVKKLRAFETVTPEESRAGFAPDFSIGDCESVVERSAAHIARFIEKTERAFPGYDHIVMTAGRDSQLVWLAPRVAPERWHVFSAEPNHPLVVEWLERNHIRAGRVFHHDNRNEETPEDFRAKVICGDLYSDPTHLRWMPAARRVAAEFGQRCIFWSGTMSNPAHFYAGQHRLDYAHDKAAFFRAHFERTASWQGNYHQVFRNFTGRPHLSPFHSPDIWNDLYSHIDPTRLPRDADLRVEVGELLAGRKVWWLPSNPGPTTYSYRAYVNLRKLYVRHIQEEVSHGRR